MNSQKSNCSKDFDDKESDGKAPKLFIKIADRPTFILKTRDGENRALSPNQKNGLNRKETEDQTCAPKPPVETKILIPVVEEMSTFTKFMDNNMQLNENVLKYLTDQQDFLVVGVLGAQGVGKSTIMSLLASNYVSDVFPVQSLSQYKNASNCTSGIDLYITKNRVIYLDTQPILSSSIVTTSTLSTQEPFNTAEHNLELQSLQFTAFLYSICHVIIFVQDWFVDPNLIRFLQTAEMLKPSSTSNLDQDYVEYYPHILFLHNKAETNDFLPNTIQMMKDFYRKTFLTSRLQIHSGIDMNPNTNTQGQLNLFLIPKIDPNHESIIHDNEKELIQQLRRKINGASTSLLTPSTLTEKNWYHYASKVLEAIKKSHLSLEYARLLP